MKINLNMPEDSQYKIVKIVETLKRVRIVKIVKTEAK